MYFKDERHRAAFSNAVKGLNQKDRKLMSKIYLLSADRALWRAARRELKGNRLPLNKIRLSFCTEWSYTLLCCAKDLAYGTEHITAADLADREVISAKLYKVLQTAMAICRCGIMENCEEE